MNDNHVDILDGINHLISAQEAYYVHYERFYREMCDLLDSQYYSEGQGWHRGMPRGRGRR